MRKQIALFAAIALGASGSLTGPAAAGPPKIDVSSDSITCNTVIATAWIKDPLVLGGTATTVRVRLKGSLAGCFSTDAAVTIDSGKFSGTLTGNTNDCLNLPGVQPLTGALTYKWRANRATPIQQKSSKQVVNAITGGFFSAAVADPAFAGSGYISVTLGTGAVTGAFTGGDAGASSTNISVISEDLGALFTECGLKGVKRIRIGLGKIKLG